MIVVVLAVYKSCNKRREIEIRRDINSTYAHVITEGIDQNVNNTALFPPPPPPYGLVTDPAINPSSVQTEIKPEQTLPNNQTATPNNWGNLLTGSAVSGVTGYLLSRRR